jgi:hypothetical protein
VVTGFVRPGCFTTWASAAGPPWAARVRRPGGVDDSRTSSRAQLHAQLVLFVTRCYVVNQKNRGERCRLQRCSLSGATKPLRFGCTSCDELRCCPIASRWVARSRSRRICTCGAEGEAPVLIAATYNNAGPRARACRESGRVRQRVSVKARSPTTCSPNLEHSPSARTATAHATEDSRTPCRSERRCGCESATATGHAERQRPLLIRAPWANSGGADRQPIT